jgi:DNA-directed RNA polymerase subunit RPC12/RpoP
MGDDLFKCVKCSSKMVKGFVTDYGGSATYFPSYWVEGEPAKKSLFGITGSNLDISDKTKFTVRALRCEKCGFLESYAV